MMFSDQLGEDVGKAQLCLRGDHKPCPTSRPSCYLGLGHHSILVLCSGFFSCISSLAFLINSYLAVLIQLPVTCQCLSADWGRVEFGIGAQCSYSGFPAWICFIQACWICFRVRTSGCQQILLEVQAAQALVLLQPLLSTPCLYPTTLCELLRQRGQQS